MFIIVKGGTAVMTKQSKYTVRKAVAADIPALADIARHAPDVWHRPNLQEALASPYRRLLVAVSCAGTVQGFICMRCVAAQGELEMLVVAPKARGQGVGRRLLTQGLAYIQQQGAGRCLLEVRAGNTGAVRLYQALGFYTIAQRPQLYSAPTEDGLCMQIEWNEGNMYENIGN